MAIRRRQGSHIWCMPHQLGAYCLARTAPVRWRWIASIPCTHAGSLILMGKFQAHQRLINDLLMDKCWHNFCLVAYAFVARPVGVADTPFSLGDTNGKDRRRCNADAEGQRSEIR
ncbi:hypothetical protein ACI1V7_10715 [Massilia sp. TN1-12]